MKRFSYSLLIALTVLSLSFQGCKKDKDDVSTTKVMDSESSEVASDNATTEQVDNDGFDLTNDALNLKGLNSNKTDGEIAVILDDDSKTIIKYDDPADSSNPGKWPKKITITFTGKDSLGKLCKDGKYRKGKIKIVLTNKFREKGSVAEISYDGYSVNGNTITGDKRIQNMGLNADGNLYWKVEVKKHKYRRSDGKEISWSSTRFIEEIRTGGVLTAWVVTGESSGVTGNGVEYSIKITKGLRINRGCRWIVSGTMEVTPKGKLTRTIDFGNGACDRLATISIAGVSYTFEMGK